MSRWQAEQQQDAVADLFAEVYPGTASGEPYDRPAFLRRFTADTRRPGFDMVVASERRITGAAYGYVLDRYDDPWRDVDGELPPRARELTASGQVFTLAELMVLPDFRRQGIATRLIGQLVLRSNAALFTVRVGADADAAHHALRAWGWTRVGDLQPSTQLWTRVRATR
ncbi:MAG TPA: GNAT family N-acetyltransferase [Streptomyces sp.]